MGFGMLMGAGLGLQDDGYGVGMSLLCGAFIGVFYSIFTVPAGALIGFLRGQAAQGKVVEYVIGEDEWRIVKQ